MARTISGLNREPLIARGHAFAKAEISHGLRVGARAVIARERMRGAKLLIASAAIDIIAAPIGAGLGFDAVIATPVSWDGNDRLIAKLPGENCYGLEKLNMVKNWLAARGYERENVTITAYSDSSSDLELLRFADIGIAVNPSAKLAQLAPQYGIEIQDWDQL